MRVYEYGDHELVTLVFPICSVEGCPDNRCVRTSVEPDGPGCEGTFRNMGPAIDAIPHGFYLVCPCGIWHTEEVCSSHPDEMGIAHAAKENEE